MTTAATLFDVAPLDVVAVLVGECFEEVLTRMIVIPVRDEIYVVTRGRMIDRVDGLLDNERTVVRVVRLFKIRRPRVVVHTIRDRFDVVVGNARHVRLSFHRQESRFPNLFGATGEADFLRKTDAEEPKCEHLRESIREAVAHRRNHAPIEEHVMDTEAPPDRPHEIMDARDLPPPQPLQNTLERLVELDDETVLVQLNDRAPQHLYPKLTDRGYQYETLDTELGVITVIWLPSQ